MQRKKTTSFSSRAQCNAVIFFDSVISSSNKGFYLVTALRGLSLPEEAALSQTPHAHTFNDFLNVTECQAGGNKSRGPPPACQWSLVVFTTLQRCRAGHIRTQVWPRFHRTGWWHDLMHSLLRRRVRRTPCQWRSSDWARRILTNVSFVNASQKQITQPTSDYKEFSVVGQLHSQTPLCVYIYIYLFFFFAPFQKGLKSV